MATSKGNNFELPQTDRYTSKAGELIVVMPNEKEGGVNKGAK